VGEGRKWFEIDNAKGGRTDEREPAHCVGKKRTRKVRQKKEKLYVQAQLGKGRCHSPAAIVGRQERAPEEAGVHLSNVGIEK
jgi:hypothetical protein